MKLQNILPAVLLMMESTVQAQTAITVNGQVVGNVDSCMVTLVDCENPQKARLWFPPSLWEKTSRSLLR